MDKWSARLHFHFKIDPDTLDEDEWWRLKERLRFVMLENLDLKNGKEIML